MKFASSESEIGYNFFLLYTFFFIINTIKFVSTMLFSPPPIPYLLLPWGGGVGDKDWDPMLGISPAFGLRP